MGNMWMQNLGVTALAILAGAAVLVSCRRHFDSPFMPDSPSYAGDEWTRDADRDGVADSIGKYSPDCQSSPKVCLEKAKVISRISFQRNTLIARDVLLWAGDSAQAPNLEWTPVEGALRGYVLNSSDSAKVCIRNGRLLPVAAGSAQISVTVPGADSLFASFIVKVVSGGTRLESVSVKDMAVSVGRDTIADVHWTPANADFCDYFLVSDLPLVARIVDGRTIRGVHPGKANITLVAMDGSRKTAFSVTVSDGPKVVYASGLTAETMYLVKGGGEETPKLQWIPSNVTNKIYKLVPMDTRYVTVTGDSLRVIPLEAGTATVLAKALDGSGKATEFTVVVNATTVRLASMSAANFTMNLSDIPRDADIVFTPSNAGNKSVTLASPTGTSVISINAQNKVVAEAPGKALLTAVSNENSAIVTSCTVTVVALVKSLTAKKDTLRLGQADRNVSALLTWDPPNATDKRFNLAVSDTNVVKPSGMTYKAMGGGTATVTASALDGSGKSVTFTVLVKVPVAAVIAKDITLNVGPLIHNIDSLMAFQPATAADKNWFLTYADATASPAPSTIAIIHNGSQLQVIAPGTARMIAISNDNPAAKDTFTVTVPVPVQVPLEGIQGANLSINLLLDGDVPPVITFTPSDAGNKGYTLTSLNTDVVTIVNGKIRPMNRGRAEVAVTSLENGDIMDTFEVSVDFFGF